MSDDTERLVARVREAYDTQVCLEVQGGGTRRDMGREPVGEILSVAQHTGIVAYEPADFVVTVRAGTPVKDLEAVLAGEDQVLMADVPRCGSLSTIGGATAIGFTGPGRPYTGALRDTLLGVRLISGTGQVLTFGGQVLKNVAGFDVSRLMVGAFGTLGVLLDVTLRVARRPETEQIRTLTLDWPQARQRLQEWEGVLPITGAYYEQGILSVRLAGAEVTVASACRTVGGDVGRAQVFQELRDLNLDYFRSPGSLWRLLVPPHSPWDRDGGLIDWAGAQRFWITEGPAALVHAKAAHYGGQAMCVRGLDRSEPAWAVPPPALMALMTRVKAALDPRGILNRGRLYPEW